MDTESQPTALELLNKIEKLERDRETIRKAFNLALNQFDKELEKTREELKKWIARTDGMATSQPTEGE